MVILQKEANAEPYFEYELTATPSALFKDGFMCKADKSLLQHELIRACLDQHLIANRSREVLGDLAQSKTWMIAITMRRAAAVQLGLQPIPYCAAAPVLVNSADANNWPLTPRTPGEGDGVGVGSWSMSVGDVWWDAVGWVTCARGVAAVIVVLGGVCWRRMVASR